MSILVKLQVKENAKFEDKTLTVSKEFMDAFENEVLALLKKACKRAYDNGRVTVMAKDL